MRVCLLRDGMLVFRGVKGVCAAIKLVYCTRPSHADMLQAVQRTDILHAL